MRSVLLVLLASASATAAPRVGAWGEDPRVVPPFALIEERRAPKMPSAATVWAELQAPHTWEAIERGLIVCKLQVGLAESRGNRAIDAIASLGTSELRRANATVRLTVGKAPTIKLYGPLFHDESIVSIPALTMRSGDHVTLALADRGVLREKPLGRASMVWDGQSPFTFTTPAWTATCGVTDHDDALRRAQTWLASLDRQLTALGQAKASRELPELGRPRQILQQLEGAFNDPRTKEGNFRYAAGFLGWDAPELQERIGTMQEAEATFDLAAADEVRAILASLLDGPLLLYDFKAHVSARDASSLAVGIADDGLSCEKVVSELEGVTLIDDAGHYLDATATVADAKGHRCDEEHPDLLLKAPITAQLRTITPTHGKIVLLRSKLGFMKF